MKRFSLVIVMLFVSMQLTLGQIPQTTSFQGVLSNTDGSVVEDGNYNLTFKLYDSSIDGTPLWEETQEVPTANGIFNVILGDVDPLSLPFDRQYWLGISIAGGEEQTPRIELTSSFYSLNAKSVEDSTISTLKIQDNAITTEKLSDGSVTQEKLHSSVSLPPGGSAGGDLTGNYPDPSIANNAVNSDKIEDNTITEADIATSILSSIDGVSNDGGNVDLVEGSNITITPDDGANTITIAAAGGTGGDDLGNHTATENIKLNGHWLSNDGGNEGVSVENDGDIVTSRHITSTSGYIRTGSPTNSHGPGDIVATGEVKADENIICQGGYIVTGAGSTLPSSTYGNGDIASTRDVFADDNVQATSGYVRSGTPSQAYGDGDIVATDDVIADGQCRGYGSGSVNYSVLGINGSIKGWLASSSIGARGEYSSTRYGYLGSSSYGAYAQYSSSIYARIGVSNAGVWAYNGTKYGILAYSARGVEGYYDSSHWGYIGSSSLGGYFKGDVDIDGHLSKSTGSFKIDHPLDPSNKYLYHSFVESPDMKNIYDGVVVLNSNGEATVELPDWFEALNKDFRYQLTCIGSFAPVYISEEINNNQFKIAGGKSGMKVSWNVTGIRNDAYAKANRIQVEVNKEGEELGKYKHPEVFGMPLEMSVDYNMPAGSKIEESQEIMETSYIDEE